MKKPTYHPLGDRALLVQYENRIDPKINEHMRLLADAMDKSGFAWLQDLVFTFQSLLVHYDPQQAGYHEVVGAVKSIEAGLWHRRSTLQFNCRTYEIGTVYGGPLGPDLQRVATLTHRTPEEVVREFSTTVFTVFFLGFLGAQPYLGGLPEYFRVPRLDTPRPKVPAGSVGIGGLQAGVVTIDQPSGFNFIGWTPLSLYTPQTSPPSGLHAGDRLIFKEISATEANAFQGKSPKPIIREDGKRP